MTSGERRKVLETLTPAQLHDRQIERQLRLVELRTIKILRRQQISRKGSGLTPFGDDRRWIPCLLSIQHRRKRKTPQSPVPWRGYDSPSDAQLDDLLHRANELVSLGQRHASPEDLRPTDNGIRARRAVLALLQIRETRRHLDDGNAPRAAYAAMQVVAYGGVLLMHALTNTVTALEQRRKGGDKSSALYEEARAFCRKEASRLRLKHPKWSNNYIAQHILDGGLIPQQLRKDKQHVGKAELTTVVLSTIRKWIKNK